MRYGRTVANFARGLLVAGALLLASPDAHAVLQMTTFDGTVTLDNSGTNPFGLTIGDNVFGSATWDDSDVLGNDANEAVFLNGLPGWDFTITLGSFSFSQSDVTDPTFTRFFFDFGMFDGIRLFIEPITIGIFPNLLIEDFNSARSLFVEDATGSPDFLELDWDFANAVTTPVGGPPTPVSEPGTLLLFGFGVLALGLARRRKTA